MKTRLIAITTLVLVLALPAALYAQETDPASVVTALYEACNAGDVEAVLALLADDAVVNLEVPGAPETYTGLEEIRAWLEDLVAQHWEGEFEILQVEGDTVTSRLTSYADFSRALGIAPLVGTEVYTVQDGKIKGFTWTPTEESAAKLQAAMAALPETGGAAFPSYALAMALGALAILGGLGLKLLHHRSHQQG